MNNLDLSALEDFSIILEDFEFTWAFKKLIKLPHKIIGAFTGNQWGKTNQFMLLYVYRILGIHPVPDKNVVYLKCESRYCKNGHKYNYRDMPKDSICPQCDQEEPMYVSKNSAHKFLIRTGLEGQPCPECGAKIDIHQRGSRIIRFCAETLPGEKTSTGGQSAEINNTVYPAFKKWLPPSLLIKDITARNAAMTIKDVYGGPNIIVEFVSYKQGTQRSAGVQRMSCYMDEESPLDFYHEQIPRLLSENGDLIIGCTPAERMTFYYDEIFQKAKLYIRTPTIGKKLDIPLFEKTDSTFDIAVIQAATDDNPTLDRDTIEEQFRNIAENDPDTLLVRRYGVFRQISGRIFKDFDYPIHYIDRKKYFEKGIPHGWQHGRFIDYHSHNPWACLHISISPTDEIFIWGEYNPSPDRVSAWDMLREFYALGDPYDMTVALVDPYAEHVQKDGISVLDDMNRHGYQLHKEGAGKHRQWKSWDTKSSRGRDEIIMRLKNSVICGTPNNNKQKLHGRERQLGTLWILDDSPLTAKSFKNWRYEEHMDQRARVSKDAKEQPQQKWSHHPMCVEASFKENSFRARPIRNNVVQMYQQPNYYNSRRAV